ncbi:MAG TPA: cation:proton antiporter [Vicinamibacteria bacterium]|nr:cation:proton antiporter [Vicinamibacteria bacterium]
MRRLLALVLLLALAASVRGLAAGEAAETRSTGLALGFALLAAALTGTLFERLRLPRVSGYLVFGLVCGPYLADIISRPMARGLQIVNGLAVTLIALVAGLEMNLTHLRPRLGGMLKMGSVILAVCYGGVFTALMLAWPWLPIAPDVSGLARVAIASVVTTLVVSFSPTVTIAVIAESRARGPLSELVLTLVVLGDLAIIVAFALTMQFTRWATGGAVPGDVGLLANLTWEIFASLALGSILGAAFAFYLRHVGRELTLVLLALCALLTAVAARLHLDAVLAALAAGLVTENLGPRAGDLLKEAVERGALPVLILFFAGAGASLNLDVLAQIGTAAVAVGAVRLAFIRLGARWGARAAGLGPPVAGLTWTGLVSQGGITLGLAVLVTSGFPEWGPAVQTLVVALISLHVLVGPILLRAGLARAGEVGRLDAATENGRA